MKPIILTAFFLLTTLSSSLSAAEKYLFGDLTYSVKQSGINYRFVFSDNISNPELRKQAGIHILKTVYQDSTIQPWTAQSYKKERAQCYAIDSRFYTYTLCFLPHEFTQKKQLLQGFVTRVPNGFWQLTRVFLPVAPVFGGAFYLFRHKPNSTS